MTTFIMTLWLVTGEVTFTLQQGLSCDEFYKYLEEVSPSLAERLELYKLKLPLFESFGIDSEIEKSN